MIRSKKQAVAELGQFESLFVQTVMDGFRAFRSYGALRFRHRRRTDTSIISDLIADQAKANFADIPGVSITDKYASLLIGFFGRWVVKIKKLDSKLRNMNVESQAVLAFVNQNLELPGLESPTCLHLGYQRQDTVELENSAVYLVCPDGRRLAWDWPLSASSELVLPVGSIPSTPPVPRTREVRPRPQEGAANEAEKKDEAGNASE